MDHQRECDLSLPELRDINSTFMDLLFRILGDLENPPSPLVPVKPELSACPADYQSGGYGGCVSPPVGPDPNPAYVTLVQTNLGQPDPMWSQMDSYSQGQQMLDHWTVPYTWTPAVAADVAVVHLPLGQENTVQRSPQWIYTDCDGQRQLLHQWHRHNMLTSAAAAPVHYPPPPPPPPPAPAPAPAAPPRTVKNVRRHMNLLPAVEGVKQEKDVYVKKPLNAFMLFRKEQRECVVAECDVSDSAFINTVLGKRWKSLSDKEQAKYYEQARKEKLLHAQRHPEWSSKDNYGKKKKRCHKRAPTNAEVPKSTVHQWCRSTQV